MKVKLVYDNDKDKEFMSLIEIKTPFFIDYIDMNSLNGRKEGFKVLNYWSARKLPFIEVTNDKDKLIKVFYSEIGNSVNQFIKWYERKNKEAQ